MQLGPMMNKNIIKNNFNKLVFKMLKANLSFQNKQDIQMKLKKQKLTKQDYNHISKKLKWVKKITSNNFWIGPHLQLNNFY